MTSGKSDVIVVGAGHNGLTAACYLARAGLKVLVLEAGEHIGGMTNTHTIFPQAPQHKLNLCSVDATLIRGTPVVADLQLQRFGYQEVELDPAWAVLDPDGGSIALRRDPNKTAADIRRFSAPDAEAFLDFANLLQAYFDILGPLYSTNPVRPEARALFATAGAGIRHIGKLGRIASVLSMPAVQFLDERFQHPLVKGLLASMVTCVTSLINPGSSLPLTAWGWYQRYGNARIIGGTGMLPLALSRCLAESGGQIRTSARVEELLVRGDKVCGVRLAGGEELMADSVITACDPHQALNKLLPAGTLPQHLQKRVAHISSSKSTVGFKIDMAFSGRLDMSRHQAWRKDNVDLRKPILCQGAFEQQVHAAQEVAAGRVPDFLPYTITIPTAVDPSQAPEGQDTVYIYASPMPFNPAESWDDLAKRGGDAVLKDAAQYYEGIAELELARRVEPWPGIQERTLATNGSWHHVDIGYTTMGPLRPALGFAGYRTPVPGLFLTGAGTHPGSGISGMPGVLAARTVLKTMRKR